MVRSFEQTSIKTTGSSESHFFFVYSLVLEYKTITWLIVFFFILLPNWTNDF